MFSKISRYRYLPNTVRVDARGRSAEVKTLRLRPEVSGTLRHTVEEGDRLDHLAYKYYQQPALWWRILDANPEIASPRALTSEEPIVTWRFPLGIGGSSAAPPWSELLRQVGNLQGVEDVAAEEEPVEPVAVAASAAGDPVLEARFARALLVRFNHLSVGLEEVSAQVEAVTTTAGPPTKLGQVGKQIIIPARAVGRGS